MINKNTKKIIGCIPARYASTRLPGKPLCDIAGKPMILHVIEKAKGATALSEVIVLTDDQRIIDVVESAGHQACMTSNHCKSGTDRIAEYMQHSDADIFVNIQGDEVTLDPKNIDQLVYQFTQQPNAEMGTLAHLCDNKQALTLPSNVKLVTSLNNLALYFSRNMIPMTQSGIIAEQGLIHIGIYIYTRETLAILTKLEQSPLEKIEQLEQLRALENCIPIIVVTLDDYSGLSVDTVDDLEKARLLLSE